MSGGGTVKNSSWIQYAAPLQGKSLQDNNFWEFVPTVQGNFSAQPRSGTAPLTVRFTDNSSGYPTTWNWVMDYNETLQNGLITCLSPGCTYTYTAPGTYNVQMRIFNAVSSDYVTKTGYITVNTASVIIPLPGMTALPTDPDGDGLYEDLNGNGRVDYADIVLFFRQIDWIGANEPAGIVDFNGNGRIDFADIVRLFHEV
jgi:PKD repeat protein